jgi:hypothetical protein
LAVVREAGEKAAPSEEVVAAQAGKMPVAVGVQRFEVPARAGGNRSCHKTTGRVRSGRHIVDKRP